MTSIPCYDIFELKLTGPSGGNPALDVTFTARFQHRNRSLEAEGFTDGEGIYRVRLMPDEPGEWRYATTSNITALDGVTGSFVCVPARPNVHGPVRVAGQPHPKAARLHFAYADGTRHFSFGTACYGWVNQPSELQEQTLQTLAAAPFNKIRMCVFPKDYTYNKNEPPSYPFVGTEHEGFDFTRPNPIFWRNFEQRVGQLAELGIEADIILFHPYDRWGFSRMGQEHDDRYLRYAIARLAAYRNVWWSLANEYDVNPKELADWERFFRIVQTYDPHQHLCSIHNWVALENPGTQNFYDFGKPWVTHCSIQHAHTEQTARWRETYRKPVVIDEACYEGNIPNGWGNLSGEEMTRRFWEAAVRGGYCGHGECYLSPDDVLWWGKGGVLKGTSPARIAFLRRILEEIPCGWIDPIGSITNTHLESGGQPGKYYLTYFGVRQPAEVTVNLPETGTYRVDVLDTWAMTITPLGEFGSQFTIPLPGKPYLALRIVRI